MHEVASASLPPADRFKLGHARNPFHFLEWSQHRCNCSMIGTTSCTRMVQVVNHILHCLSNTHARGDFKSASTAARGSSGTLGTESMGSLHRHGGGSLGKGKWLSGPVSSQQERSTKGGCGLASAPEVKWLYLNEVPETRPAATPINCSKGRCN